MKNIQYFLILVFCLYNAKETRSEERKGSRSIHQNWGYVTVRGGAHYFWWLYYSPSSESNWQNKPLLISLTTGIYKGASGSENFDQIGPLDIDLNARNNTWLNDFNILFIDNILGCGFSYVDNETNYATTSDQMGEDTFEVIKNFLNIIPEFKTIPTYMMCENVGTVIAAKTASIWAQAQTKKQVESSFKAVVLGAPWISLIDVINFWASPSNKDKFSEEEIKEIESKARDAKEAMEKEQYYDVFMSFALQLMSLKKHFKLNNLYNLSPKVATNYSDVEKDNKLKDLMNNVKNVLKIDHEWKNDPSKTELTNFGNMTAKPIKDTLEQLLQADVRVVIIAGKNDLVIPVPSVDSWVNNFNWPNKKEFQTAKQFDFDGISEKKYGNLEYYLIEAGHLLKVDNLQDLRRILIKITHE